MGHQAVEMFVQIRFFVHCEIMQVGFLDFVLIEQRRAPALGPVAEHLFVERARPPLDHAAFVNQTAGKLGQSAAFGEHLAIDHLVNRQAEGFALLDQNLDMSGNARVDQLIADLTDIGCEQVAVARENALVALVDNQVKIVDFHRITVPVAPKEPDGIERQPSRFEIAHERAAENLLVPARVHALFDRAGKRRRLGGGKFPADLQGQRLLSRSHGRQSP